MERAIVDMKTARSFAAPQLPQASAAMPNTAIDRATSTIHQLSAIKSPSLAIKSPSLIMYCLPVEGITATAMPHEEWITARELYHEEGWLTAGLQAIATLSMALMVVGLIVGFIYPGPVMGILLPIGLVLWVLAGAVARRFEFSAKR